MHVRKTGALIRASALAGAIISGSDEHTIAAVDAYGENLGLAFQIVDDILDVEGASADLGKTAGKDAAAGKPTYRHLRTRRIAATGRAMRRPTLRVALEEAAIGGQLPAIARWVIARTN